MSQYSDAFERAYNILSGSEGGYVDHAKDPGGKTNFGITESVAREYGYQGPMSALPTDIAKQIAHTYWSEIDGDWFDFEVAYQLFDIHFNGGYAIQWLQEILGVTVDGVAGPKTKAAANSRAPEPIAALLIAKRLEYYTSLKTWSTFGKGWARRIAATIKSTIAIDK